MIATRKPVEFHVHEHNSKGLHPAFNGQTPEEMFFGNGSKVPDELALAKHTARAARMTANRTGSSELCLTKPSDPPREQIPL